MQEDDYWFSAKTYGWGWGLPLRWQGWVVYGATFILLAAMFFVFPPAKKIAFFLGGTWVVIFLLVTVCWLKGEPPRWRWRK